MKKFGPPFFVSMLKAWSALSLVLWAFLGLGCNKEDGIGQGYDMAYQRSFEIPSGIGVFDVHHFQLKNIPSNWDLYLNQHSKTDSDIVSVIPSQFTLSGIYGDVDLSVVDKISVRVYDESKPNDYVEIAYRDPAPFCKESKSASRVDLVLCCI